VRTGTLIRERVAKDACDMEEERWGALWEWIGADATVFS
jgi:hypothetical protein